MTLNQFLAELKEIAHNWETGTPNIEECPSDLIEVHNAQSEAYKIAADQIKEVVRRFETDREALI